MARTGRDLIGLSARSRDDVGIGKVLNVLAGIESQTAYVVIKKRFGHSLIVPTDVIDVRDDSVVVPYTSSYLDMAPRVDADRPLSADDRAHIEEFYHPKAA
jgi:hypothetical protein